MISAEFHDGQGLGNQLWTYFVVRVLAEKLGTSFCLIGKERFKGREFLDLDFGEDAPTIHYEYKERFETLPGTNIDVSPADRQLMMIRPYTFISGNFQSTTYLKGYERQIHLWFREYASLQKIRSKSNTCLLHVRGGDFRGHRGLSLKRKYYLGAMRHHRDRNPGIIFRVVSDDLRFAERLLPGVAPLDETRGGFEDPVKASHHLGGPVGLDFLRLVTASNLIIPNSSFSWWAGFLNHGAELILAPKYWARHNISDGYWSTGDIITDKFHYIDRKGMLQTSAECREELRGYEMHKERWRVTNTDDTPFSRESTKIVSNQKIMLDDIRRGTGGKVYDCFSFHNELELLKVRLQMLEPHVDYFVIVESEETFSGKKKDLEYWKNRDLFSSWNRKIIHFVVPRTKFESDGSKYFVSQMDSVGDSKEVAAYLSSATLPAGQYHWAREFYQKESIRIPLSNLSERDLVFLSDADEFWNPASILSWDETEIHHFSQLVYAYYLNNRSNENWLGSTLVSFKTVREKSLNAIRGEFKKVPGLATIVANGGWHFTNMGGPERIRNKIASYGHQEFNNSRILNNLQKRISRNKDFVGRRFKFWVDSADLPIQVRLMQGSHPEWFKQ